MACSASALATTAATGGAAQDTPAGRCRSWISRYPAAAAITRA